MSPVYDGSRGGPSPTCPAVWIESGRMGTNQARRGGAQRVRAKPMNRSLLGYVLGQLRVLAAVGPAEEAHTLRVAHGAERLLCLGADFAGAVEGSPAETCVIERADRLLVETGPGTRFRSVFDTA